MKNHPWDSRVNIAVRQINIGSHFRDSQLMAKVSLMSRKSCTRPIIFISCLSMSTLPGDDQAARAHPREGWPQQRASTATPSRAPKSKGRHRPLWRNYGIPVDAQRYWITFHVLATDSLTLQRDGGRQRPRTEHHKKTGDEWRELLTEKQSRKKEINWNAKCALQYVVILITLSKTPPPKL